jgi:hypothetical protein
VRRARSGGRVWKTARSGSSSGTHLHSYRRLGWRHEVFMDGCASK